ncbi:MAG TPA: ribosome recycling factor [Firmicutes bacterium]|nr:ribosome recycling factor [Bacillota bacterium]
MNHIDEVELKMEETIETLDKRLTSVRAGRANPSMLSGVMVEYYGTSTPLSSVANITVPEARQLFVKPFDRSTLKDIEKAIQEANLGINPTNNGEMIILTLPELTEDRRREYVKQAKAIGEEAKIALRNIRQDGNNKVKADELPEDEEKNALDKIQELITKYNKLVDDKVKTKSDELMEV